MHLGLIKPFDDDATERAFKKMHDAAAARQMLVVLSLAALGFLCAVLVNVFLLGMHSPAIEAVTLGYAAPMLVLLGFLARQPRLVRWSQALMVVVAVLVIGVMDFATVWLSRGEVLYYLRATPTLYTIAFYTCLGLRLRYAIISGVLYGAVVLTGFATTQHDDVTFLGVTVTLLVVANLIGGFVAYQREQSQRREFAQRRLLARERERSEQLLLNILPRQVAERLLREESEIADHHDEVTVLFADLVDFSSLASAMPARSVVSLLNGIFSRFDALAEHYGVEKIKTIGDAYMAVAGLPHPRADHAAVTARLALDMLDVLQTFNASHGTRLELRIGLNTGPVVAGVIGRRKFIYDLWGDTVNLASRMETHGVSGRIQVSAATYAALSGQFQLECRGEVDVKGKGLVTTFWLVGPQPAVPASERFPELLADVVPWTRSRAS